MMVKPNSDKGDDMTGIDKQGSDESTENKLQAKGQEVLREGREAAEKVADKASSAIGEQKSAFAAQIAEISEVAKNAAGDLREREQGVVADWVEQAADEVRRISESLRDRDLKTIYEDVGNFARRQPALFIGGTALLGFAAARLAKASSDRRAVVDMRDASGSTASTGTTPGGLPHQRGGSHG